MIHRAMHALTNFPLSTTCGPSLYEISCPLAEGIAGHKPEKDT